jgi:hypothetical protein
VGAAEEAETIEVSPGFMLGIIGASLSEIKSLELKSLTGETERKIQADEDLK